MGRAYVAGMIEVDDLDAALLMVDTFEPPPLTLAQRAGLARRAWSAPAGWWLPPPPPKAELRLRGARHTIARDRRAVRHHYDVGNEFFALFLDPSMTYSCAYWSGGATTLEEAQEAKLELVCKKLGLREGERVLDVGCGWGSFVIHAATRHGVRAVGITLSEEQARLARERARRGRRGRSRGVPGRRLPRGVGRAVRRDRQHRHGRARGRGADRRLRAAAARACCAPAGGCSTTGSPSSRTSTRPTRARSPSGSCSPTVSRSRSRGSCTHWSAPSSRRRTSRVSRATTRGHRLLDRALRCPLGRRGAAGRDRARPDLAAVPAGGPPGVRDRVGVGLPGPGSPLSAARACADPRRAGLDALHTGISGGVSSALRVPAKTLEGEA